MKKKEASYTVELALLLPVMLFVLIAPIYTGYEMYAQTKQMSASGWEASFGAEKKVRKIKFVKYLLEEWK